MAERKIYTADQLRAAWRLVCWGEGSIVNLADALGCDWRTAKAWTLTRLDECLPPNAAAVDVTEWCALNSPAWHVRESMQARQVRGDLAAVADNLLGAAMAARIEREFPRLVNRHAKSRADRYRAVYVVHGADWRRRG